jgi:Tfp pilus assembly protein PilN
MNYFRINLNKLEDKELALQHKKRELLKYAVLTGLVLLLFAVALTINGKLASKVNSFNRTISSLNKQIDSLQQNENFVSEEEVYSLDRLNSSRVFWTKKLETLAEITGNSIALTEIKYERTVLLIRGVARVSRANNNFEVISGFIERLKAEPSFFKDFKAIDFRSSSRVDFLEQNLLNFEIVLQ